MRTRTTLAALVATAWLALSPAVAHANDAEVKAEHRRLSDQLTTLAERNAWTGVDRTFRQLQELDVELTAAEWRLGAEGSRALGDAGTAHDRYFQSLQLEPHDEADGALQDLRKNYGRVDLLCKPGSVELKIDERPFQPDKARAVDFAMARVVEQGEFSGMLPEAVYTFGPYTFAVIPGQPAATFDTRRLDLETTGGETDADADAGDASDLPDEARPPKPARAPIDLPFNTPLAGGAAGSAVIAGVLYGVAASRHSQWQSTETYADLDPLRAQTNGLVVGAGVLGAAAIGLGVTAFTVEARF